MFPYMFCVPIMVLFFEAGRGIGIALLLHCEISPYDMITSRAMRVIWDVNSVLLSYPYLGHCFQESINSSTQSVGETGEDAFPQLFPHFLSFRFVITAFEDLEFL